jgi:protein FRG1
VKQVCFDYIHTFTLSIGQVEFDHLKMFHSIQASSFGERDLSRTKEDTKRLKRAKEEGNLNEMLLDRRAKSKSDKFC